MEQTLRIQAILTEERFVVNQSHQILRPLKDTVIDFVVGIVNSRLLSFLHVNKSALALRDDFPKLVLDDTRSFPIPKLSSPVLPGHDSIKQLNQLVEGTQPLTAAFCKLPKDAAAGIIAAAVPQMMTMDKELRMVKRLFLSELAEMLGQRSGVILDAFDDFQGKSLILDFAGDYQRSEGEAPFEEIVNVLRRNRRKTPADCLAEGSLRRLRERYQACLETVVPLKRMLAKTDSAIDLMVYQLYDLTEEEIGIVEAGTSHWGGQS